MDEKTLDVLKASIQHWRDVVDNPLTTAVGPTTCALCAAFQNDDCCGCPVAAASGRHYCCGTPYGDFDEYTCLADPDEAVARQLATDELTFLENLLPPGSVA